MAQIHDRMPVLMYPKDYDARMSPYECIRFAGC